MAWLFNPADLARFPHAAQSRDMPKFLPAGAIEVRADSEVERGHIRDTDHPEIGCVTFAEFGSAYAKVLEDERKAFNKTVALLGEFLAPLDAGTREGLRRAYQGEAVEVADEMAGCSVESSPRQEAPWTKPTFGSCGMRTWLPTRLGDSVPPMPTDAEPEIPHSAAPICSCRRHASPGFPGVSLETRADCPLHGTRASDRRGG